MKYIIERASQFIKGGIPCYGCVKEHVHEIMWDGSIDTNTVERWTIEIDDLLEFVEDYGKIVLSKSLISEYKYEITIYDDYIE